MQQVSDASPQLDHMKPGNQFAAAALCVESSLKFQNWKSPVAMDTIRCNQRPPFQSMPTLAKEWEWTVKSICYVFISILGTHAMISDSKNSCNNAVHVKEMHLTSHGSSQLSHWAMAKCHRVLWRIHAKLVAFHHCIDDPKHIPKWATVGQFSLAASLTPPLSWLQCPCTKRLFPFKTFICLNIATINTEKWSNMRWDWCTVSELLHETAAVTCAWNWSHHWLWVQNVLTALRVITTQKNYMSLWIKKVCNPFEEPIKWGNITILTWGEAWIPLCEGQCIAPTHLHSTLNWRLSWCTKLFVIEIHASWKHRCLTSCCFEIGSFILTIARMVWKCQVWKWCTNQIHHMALLWSLAPKRMASGSKQKSLDWCAWFSCHCLKWVSVCWVVLNWFNSHDLALSAHFEGTLAKDGMIWVDGCNTV